MGKHLRNIFNKPLGLPWGHANVVGFFDNGDFAWCNPDRLLHELTPANKPLNK
jgi:hypothetical protein